MSRLDSFIRRLEAQRACLDFSIRNLVPGAVLELGLGNGRSYDHLRERLAGSRAIYALDRQLSAHPDCVPTELILGEFRDTLPRLSSRIGRSVA
ncbi:MAG TPA: class I SAM-dependent methyltransferase, partial [Burkholderiales bacterium]